MYGYIYKTTNLINNKIYIGKHKYSKNHIDEKYIGSGKLLTTAVKKYGKENFISEILEWCENLQQLNEKEIFYIQKFNSIDKEVGYNITKGGEGTDGYIFTDEVKKVMSAKAKKRDHPPTTLHRIYIHKETENKCIKKEDLQFYLDNGFIIGKFIKDENRKAWNRGLTAQSDDRVNSYVQKRLKKIETGKQVGFCNLHGDSVPNRKRFLRKLYDTDKDQFISDFNAYGKCYCLSKYHFSPYRWEELCKYFNITSNNKTWKNHGNSSNEDNHEPCL